MRSRRTPIVRSCGASTRSSRTKTSGRRWATPLAGRLQHCPARAARRSPMDWREWIEINPAILVGKPVVKGTRLAVDFLLDLVAAGCPEDEILRNYPGLTHKDLLAC